MSRQLISTGSKWEPIIGYSRAVKVGNQIFVSGTTGTGADGKVAKGDLEAQTRQAILNIQAGLEKAGAKLEHVVRTRLYMTDISQWEAVGRAHGEMFAEMIKNG